MNQPIKRFHDITKAVYGNYYEDLGKTEITDDSTLEIVKIKGEEVIKYVDRELVKYDTKFAAGGQCEIPKEFIKAHNDAAEAPK